MALSMSRPAASVPRRKLSPFAPRLPGGSSLLTTDTTARSYGFCGETTGASAAMPITAIRTSSAIAATRSATKRTNRRRQGDSGAAILPGGGAVTAVFMARERRSGGGFDAQPGVEKDVDRVDGQVDQHED